MDTRRNVPKKRTRFPGQIIECGICGRGYVFGGHGQTDHLMCNGAREYKCWNGITVDGPLAAEKICSAVIAEIEAGKHDFASLEKYMLAKGEAAANTSGRHELFENVVNRYVF